jgi:predicted small lipoprotein YifL
MRLLRLVCLLGAALAAALATSACGIKGPLIYPDGAPAPHSTGSRPGAPAQ